MSMQIGTMLVTAGDRESSTKSVGDVVENVEATNTQTTAAQAEYPTFKKLMVIMAAVLLCFFLVIMDRTIIGTAIPQITDDFHTIKDVGWYASGYLLTNCCFQFIYGKLYTFYSAKIVLNSAIATFEIGSLVTGFAHSSKVFIVGRAISGLGAAGVFNGCFRMQNLMIPLHKRPTYQGISGAIIGLASIAGPLVGGALTTAASWRWCFWINVPVGIIAMIILIIVVPPTLATAQGTFRQQIKPFDPFGTAAFIPGVVCLLLALQWGGTEYAWGSVQIIALFVIAGVLLSLFVGIQFWQGENATVPIRIITQRSIACCVLWSLLSPGSMMIIVYFLPLWFQVIKGVTAIQSGVDTLPMVFALVVASLLAGKITKRTGYYIPQLIACSVIMSIGAGLITILQVDTGRGMWIGFQIIYGFGLGLGISQLTMAVQTCLNNRDIMTGVSLIYFMQSLGGSIFMAVAQTVFTNSLVANFPKDAGLDSSMIVRHGALQLLNVVPQQYRSQLLVAINAALMNTFKVGAACASVTIVGALGMEWKSVKGRNQGGEQEVEL